MHTLCHLVTQYSEVHCVMSPKKHLRRKLAQNSDHSVEILLSGKWSNRTCHLFSSVSQDLSVEHETSHQSSAEKCDEQALRDTGSPSAESIEQTSKLSKNQKRKLKKKRHKERVRSSGWVSVKCDVHGMESFIVTKKQERVRFTILTPILLIVALLSSVRISIIYLFFFNSVWHAYILFKNKISEGKREALCFSW